MSDLFTNRYLVLDRIGQGGMADVFLAEDTILKRKVAIKILRGELTNDPVSLLRFKREADAVSKLVHPNIVEIYDVGEENGKPYLVMEYIKGQTLKQLITKRGALYKEEAIAIMKQLVSAIATANSKGIIHRDIKPQNILVKDDGTVKITDFGIASTQDAVQLTQKDSVMGSVHYLAPELARGEVATAQSDIYSLGIVFYELLTGDVPYRGDSAVEVAMKHLSGSLSSVKEFNPSLPQSVENIIIKSTAKNRIHRYKDAKEMYVDLTTALDEKRYNEKKLEITDTDESKTMMIDKIGESKKKRNKIIAAVSVAAVAIISIIVLVSILSGNNDHNKVTVPDVSGKDVTEAKLELEELGFVVELRYKEVVTDDLEKNKVVETLPNANTQLDKGTKISLVVSKGKWIIVEDYTNKKLTDVQEMYKDTNINLVIKNEFNKDYPLGVIFKQEGSAIGEKLDPTIRKEVVLYVSSTKELVLPTHLLGQPISYVEEYLKNEGLMVRLEVLDPNAQPPEDKIKTRINVLIASDPLLGTFYEQTKDSYITLYYYDRMPDIEETPDPETPVDPGDNGGN